jgi:predicted nuclease of predicted toxin-antitoxin system
MKVQLFLDEDVHMALALALRRRGYDVVHAQEADRKGKSDAEQLAYAVEHSRCLVSFNVKDFVLLHNAYVDRGQEHWGILVSKHRPVGEVLRRLLRILQVFSQESIRNRLEFL